MRVRGLPLTNLGRLTTRLFYQLHYDELAVFTPRVWAAELKYERT